MRVWTNVGDAHLGFFASREAIADAKAEILEDARPTDLLVANGDDALVMSRAASFAGRVVTFGESASAQVRAAEVVDRGFDGTTSRLVTPAGHGDEPSATERVLKHQLVPRDSTLALPSRKRRAGPARG